MRRYKKEDRQRIIDDYTERHGGYSAEGFLQEVRDSHGSHEAWSWFEWRDGYAAEEYRLWQARTFTLGLKISFTVTVIERDELTTMVLRQAPALLSPLDQRRHGGGYYVVDPTSEAHMAELRLQGAASLETWLRRYGDAFELVGGDLDPFHAAIALLRPEVTEEVAA